MDETLRIVVSPNGRASVEVIRSCGEQCIAATREIEQALGDVTERRKKPEFYQSTSRNRQELNRH